MRSWFWHHRQSADTHSLPAHCYEVKAKKSCTRACQGLAPKECPRRLRAGSAIANVACANQLPFEDRHVKTSNYRNPHERRMKVDVLTLAKWVISASDRAHPADGVLRAELKTQRDLSPDERTRVSAAVFAFFRWRGWLNPEKPVSDQIEAALAIAERYARQPESFSDADLVARAAPGWVASVMDVSADWARALQAHPKLWLRARRGQGGFPTSVCAMGQGRQGN